MHTMNKKTDKAHRVELAPVASQQGLTVSCSHIQAKPVRTLSSL